MTTPGTGTDVVCLGALLLDMFPAELGRGLVQVSAWHPKPGGAPANVAVAAARLGVRSAFIGKVGDDLFGHHLAQVLADNRVDISGVRYDRQARTTLTFHAKPDANTAEFLFYRNPGADTRLEASELPVDLLRDTRILHFDSLALNQEPARAATLTALRVADAAGAMISFDVNYRPTLWDSPAACVEQVLAILPRTHLLKMNEIELRLLTGQDDPKAGARSLLGLGPNLIVVTLGADGSYFCTAQAGGTVAPFPVPTVDAVGCGDAFIAALLSGLAGCSTWRDGLGSTFLSEALRYANAAGALTATAEGVIPALPSAAQVAGFLSQHEE